MEIITITICVNYHDILKYMIKQNSKFFKKWYIVTSPEDIETKKLIENENNPIIEILIYNDFYNNSTFNKGGALRYAQNYIDTKYNSSNILILDADIYLPNNFMDLIPEKLEYNTIYGIYKRVDFWNTYDFIYNRNPHIYRYGSCIVGFFQLYNQTSTNKYQNSVNCSKCDDIFRELFPIKKILKLIVKHLGKDKVNWNGRNYNYGIY
jgi:hypothetical protein